MENPRFQNPEPGIFYSGNEVEISVLNQFVNKNTAS